MQCVLSLEAKVAPPQAKHSALEFANDVSACTLPVGHALQLKLSL
jgi:hypothetical protein